MKKFNHVRKKDSMRSPIKFYMLFSVLAASIYGCTNTDDHNGENVRQYSMIIQASKDSGDIETRALFLGGNNGNRFYSLWDQGDQVEVYKSGLYVGTLTAQTYGEPYSELAGTLTGTFDVNDDLDIYLPHTTLDFTGQKGTVGDMSANHSFMMKTVKISSVDGSNITTERVVFNSCNCYLHFTFTDEDGVRLHVEQLTIHAGGGKLVQTKTKEGVATYGDMVINLDKDKGEYPSDVYVSLHNDLGAKDMYTFTVKAGGYIYCSNDASTSYINANLQDGHSYTANKTLSLQSAADKILTNSSVNDFANGGNENGSVGF